MAANLNIRQFILKRGNSTVSSAYVGSMGEITYDTTLKSIRVYDGVMPGGNIILDTGFVANLQGQIDFIRQNFDANTIDSLTEAATAISSIRANAVVEANIRASSDISLQANIVTVYANLAAKDANLQANINSVYANLQAQINSIIADKGNIRVVPANGQIFNIQLDPIAGNLILPYVDFNANPLIVGSSLVWETSSGIMSVGPTYINGVGAALNFNTVNQSFNFDQTGRLNVDHVKVSNISITANGITIITDSGGTFSASRTGNVQLADNSRIGTRDSVANNTDTAGFVVRTGTTITGNTGSIIIASADTSTGRSGDVTVKTGATTNGAGGTLRLQAGSTNFGDGGDVHINTGNSVNDVPGNGGDLLVTLGTAGTGDGGEFRLTAGTTNAGSGGAVTITAGNSSLGDAGGFSFTAGSTASGAAGGFVLAAGTSGSGSAGSIRMLAGNATGSAQAGNVLIRAGTNASNSLYHGTIILETAGGTWSHAADGSSTMPGALSVGGALNVIGSATINNNLSVLGNLTVSGTVTTLSSTTITVSDKNIELSKVSSPTDITADGAGFTILGTTNKTFAWTNATGAFNSSEPINLAATKSFKIDGNDVVTATTLGSGVVNSSLTSVGTINSGTWQASVIAPLYGGTGVNNGNKTVTLGGNFATTGPYTLTFGLTANTSITLPESGVLVTRTGVETLTNKTLTTPEITSPVILGHATIEGVTLTGTTGTGQLVFSTSPTLVTPTLGVAAATSVNKVVITAPANTATLTIADNKSLVINNSLTFAGSDASTVNFGTGGNIVYSSSKLSVFAPTTSAEFATVVTDKTGTGVVVYSTSPTLVTPTLGVATATSINKINITAPTNGATLTITDGKTLAVVNTLTFTGTDSSSVAFGAGGTVAYSGATGNKLSTFAVTTSNELSSVISDETGTGSLVFNTGPTIVNANLVNPSSISAAGNLTVDNTFVANVGTITTLTATRVNKLTLTAPATSATLTIADGKTLSVSNSLTFTGTDASSVAFGAGGTVVYTSNKLSVHAATSSSELAGIISDETGSGSLVFGTSPTITTSLVAGSSSFALLNDTATTINFGGAATTLNVGGNNVNVNFGSSTGQITAANVTATNFIGTVSNPSLPAFRVYGSSSSAIAAGTVIASAQGATIDYNQGTYYNNSTGLFTAPRAGLYHCYATVRISTNNGMNQVAIQKNASLTGANIIAFWETDTNVGTAVHFSLTGYAKLAAGDTIRLYVVTGAVTFDSLDSWGVTYIG